MCCQWESELVNPGEFGLVLSIKIMNTVAPLTQLVHFQELIPLPHFVNDVFASLLVVALFVIGSNKEMVKLTLVH